MPVKRPTPRAYDLLTCLRLRQRNDGCSARVYNNSYIHDAQQRSGDSTDYEHPANARAASRLTDR